MVELDRRYGILDFHLQLKSLVGLNHLMDTLYNAVLIETALLRLARRHGVVLPSKNEEGREVEYEGAVVLEPPAGIFEGVAVFDMARYYPNIIISFNISPDTLDTNGPIRYPPMGVAFKAEEGLIPKLVKGWLKLREELEASGAPKSKVDAVKFLANSVYGVFAYEKSRLYDVRLASTVTAIGREGILFAKGVAERMGYKVLYGDSVAGDTLVFYFTLRGKPVCELAPPYLRFGHSDR
jgi:DNA polymerase elongation subunit (family B)